MIHDSFIIYDFFLFYMLSINSAFFCIEIKLDISATQQPRRVHFQKTVIRGTLKSGASQAIHSHPFRHAIRVYPKMGECPSCLAFPYIPHFGEVLTSICSDISSDISSDPLRSERLVGVGISLMKFPFPTEIPMGPMLRLDCRGRLLEVVVPSSPSWLSTSEHVEVTGVKG